MSAGERLRDVVEEIVRADEVGLDVYAVGEHHRADFVASSPAVVLAAAATRTQRIRLTSAVTRAQLRRSGARLPGFRDARPAVGRSRRDHGRTRLVRRVVPALRLRPRRLRRAVRREARAPARAAREASASPGRDATARRCTMPASTHGPSRIRCRCGSPSAGRRRRWCAPGTLGLPLVLAIIGGAPERFAPLVELYREAALRAGHDSAGAPGGRAPARLRRRDHRGGGRRLLRAVCRGHEPARS